MKKTKKIPAFIHHTLWSYDIRQLDLEKDKRLIVTQVLNRGGAKAVHWLRQTYSPQSIRAVVQRPGRGLWFPQVLNFWKQIYHVKISKKLYQHALFSLDPIHVSF